MHIPRNWNRKNIKKYIEIFIKSEVKKIILKDKKKVYKNNKDVVGLNIKPQFPKTPDIIINNTFEKNLDYLTLELLNKISIFINKK